MTPTDDTITMTEHDDTDDEEPESEGVPAGTDETDDEFVTDRLFPLKVHEWIGGLTD